MNTILDSLLHIFETATGVVLAMIVFAMMVGGDDANAE